MNEEKNFESYTPKPNENPLIESINKFYEFETPGQEINENNNKNDNKNDNKNNNKNNIKNNNKNYNNESEYQIKKKLSFEINFDESDFKLPEDDFNVSKSTFISNKKIKNYLERPEKTI